MESRNAVKKTTLTAKAIIYQKFGQKACYKIEEVEEAPQNGCPGLNLLQKGPSLFRCFLLLPDFSVVSDPCKKKKEAEQSAAHLAILKLGIDSQSSSPTDPVDELVSRLSYIFSDEFLSSLHPLSGHLKAVLHREGKLCGLLPLSAVISCDSKLGNLCKSIDARVESNPLLSAPIVKGVVPRLSEFIIFAEEELCIERKKPYPSNIVPALDNQESNIKNGANTEAVYIPPSLDKDVVSLNMNMSSEIYYLDVIAQELGVVDASKVLISRTIGKASSEMRLYFSALEANNLIAIPKFHTTKEPSSFDGSVNIRASYLLGRLVFGNVILASVGYTWRGAELFREDVSVRSYFRMLVGKTPDGQFKLSRDAILVADLPLVFTTKTNWRGSLPRDLLCAFCRQHRLSEPVFNVVCNFKSDQESLESGNKLAADDTTMEVKSEYGVVPATNGQTSLEIKTFRCDIKLYSKNEDLILNCYPEESFKKQGDAVQNASLKVLLWFNTFFKQPNLHLEKLSLSGVSHELKCNLTSFLKEFSLCQLMHNTQLRQDTTGRKRNRDHMDPENDMTGLENKHLSMEETVSASPPSNGSLVSISYSVCLVSDGKEIQEMLERSNEFEFEIGTGAVISCIEAAILQMTAGQSTCFYIDTPPKEFILASTMDYEKVLSLLSSSPCSLKYNITLLRVTEPFEDRMEQALFSPPLSKQRLEFAMQRIEEFSAANLIDFGCGSGSLLESIVDTPSSLEKIVGVDLSQKGLTRAAKVLNLRLEKLKAVLPKSRIESVVLYEGNITVFDSRLYGFDVGTCLEVIEHMQEEQACLFGDVALGLFRPKLLIVSTPNYEYNVIMQKSNLASQEEDPDEMAEPQACKFRNHDHKFEWTREQFNQWATGLGLKHDYSVEFSGVGGDGAEPGFASQIAVFKRRNDLPVNGSGPTKETNHPFEPIWQWNADTVTTDSDSTEKLA